MLKKVNTDTQDICIFGLGPQKVIGVSACESESLMMNCGTVVS